MSYVIAQKRFKMQAGQAIQYVFRVAAILAAICVTYASLRPAVSMPSVTHFDKLMHLMAYTVLGGLFMLGWRASGWQKVAAAVVALGIIIEITQGVMGAGRTGSLLDALANTAGVAIGVTAALTLLRVVKQD
ncbi:VanZ family protein [Robiginitomaculum antarcticum]|uniref:VanZ family protein n=1 Tax=Robiginitomaculum antarcticum TaxID=437507 RepID=UPI00036576F7|nr:VanZ family protein [Robiginitomaculum antarcticum]